MSSQDSTATAHHGRAIAKSRQKACNACTKAKRRCDLQHPSCRRCVIRGIDCYYPSTRLHDTTPSTTSAGVRASTSGSSRARSDSRFRHDNSQKLISILSPSCSAAAAAMQFPFSNTAAAAATHSLLYSDELLLLQGNGISANPALFFLVPGSWTVTSGEVAQRNRIPRTVPQLNKSVYQVQRWLRQWVEEGSNMFIHKNLYYHDDDGSGGSSSGGDGAGALHMPQSIQDAYTTCAAYFACTLKNRKMMLRIIEQRVATLLTEQQEYQYRHHQDTDNSQFLSMEDNFHANGIEETRNRSSSKKTTSVQDHLARVQALLIYQLIRLYDGDMRSRLMAESLIPVLTRWCAQMLDSALLSSQYVSSSMDAHQMGGNGKEKSPASTAKKLNSDWRAWILAESVRRTWLVAGHMQCIYRLLSYGINACPGGLMFTPRAGLWHAESAYEWWARCREKTKRRAGVSDSSGGSDGLLFCQSLESGSQLLKKTNPDEVDDFGRFVLLIIAGEEKTNRWLSAERSIDN